MELDLKNCDGWYSLLPNAACAIVLCHYRHHQNMVSQTLHSKWHR